MTKELKPHQIAQLVNKLRDIATKYHAHGCLRELISREVNAALTQRPATSGWVETTAPPQRLDWSDTQQATPERHLTVTTNQQGEAVMVSWQDDEHRILEVVWERKQATPEPVGEPAVTITFGDTGMVRNLVIHNNSIKGQRLDLFTRPAPGVPDGLPAVLTDWGFDVHDDEEGRTWLTIRNPDDDVARMSVPTVWPLNGNQTIGAVVLHQFSAALSAALATPKPEPTALPTQPRKDPQ